jgi:hypothetical protein
MKLVTGKKVKPQTMLLVNILVTWAKQKTVLSRSWLTDKTQDTNR